MVSPIRFVFVAPGSSIPLGVFPRAVIRPNFQRPFLVCRCQDRVPAASLASGGTFHSKSWEISNVYQNFCLARQPWGNIVAPVGAVDDSLIKDQRVASFGCRTLAENVHPQRTVHRTKTAWISQDAPVNSSCAASRREEAPFFRHWNKLKGSISSARAGPSGGMKVACLLLWGPRQHCMSISQHFLSSLL